MKSIRNIEGKTTGGRLPAAEGATAIVSVLELIVTIFLLPETKGKSFEELSEEPSTPLEKVSA